MAEDASSLSFLVSSALQLLLNVSNPRKHKPLRDVCESVLSEVRNPGMNLQGVVKPPVSKNADRYFLPFKLACESKTGKIMEVALDYVQKLVAYQYLRGDSAIDRTQYPLDSAVREPEETGKHPRKLIDIILETVYECSTFQDDNVQLQVIKVLLTLVTSPACEVHEHSFMLAVRACYHIHLSSPNLINRTTAKATLTQMLLLLFNKMEQATADWENPANNPSSTPISKETVNLELNLNESSVTKDETLTEAVENKLKLEDKSEIAPIEVESNTLLVDIKASPKASPKNSSPSISRVSSVAPTPVVEEAAPAGKFGWCTMCKKAAQHYCLQTKVPVCSVECKQAHLATLPAVRIPSTPLTNFQQLSTNAQLLQNDCYLVFRALCKLSMKTLPSVDADDYNIALRSKVLSLELLLTILEACGVAFRTARKFIDAVKESLTLSLLESCVSELEQIFSLSLSIFVSLFRSFKPHLKTEIGVFLDNVFLRMVENPNASFGHKMMILQVFSKLAQDPQSLVDLFLNYDCDSSNSIPMYQHLVTVLEKMVQGRLVSENWISPAQEITLKMLSLESLVSAVKSLVAWSEKAQSLADSSNKEVDESVVKDVSLKDKNILDENDDEIEPNNIPNYTRFTILNNFEKIREKAKVLENGTREFNAKPKHGIKYLIKNGIILETPESISEFLHTTKGLDKAAIGDYLGENDPTCLKVLHSFVYSLDFTGLGFEGGLRHFLETFRLPGEAQKIDRILEEFSARFCFCNPGVFQSADVAYILAYSVIMLNTDLHNPMVKNKMTKEEFTRNNRGINGKEDLPQAYISDIYDNILKNEIKMKDSGVTGVDHSVHDPKYRQHIFKRESENIKNQWREKLSKPISKPASFESFTFCASDDITAIVPMFRVIWGPSLGTFSVLLQQLEEQRVVALCLDGYRFSIRLAGLFGCSIELDAFVKSLAQFTLLGTAKEMKQKNIDAVKILLTIAYSEGDRLGSSWGVVLNCISEFERLHLIGVGAPSDSSFFSGKSGQKDRYPQLEVKDKDTNASILRQIEGSLLDRIFSHSANLTSTAIISFVSELCAISKKEMSAPEPRIFSLQKIVEVTYHNMGRVRYVWSTMWSILSVHFQYAGTHPNPRISMYAIDSLRQLATKFLEKAELANYNFQKTFLYPFESIISASVSTEIREFILQCMSRMIFARISNVKSGWGAVFSVLFVAAKDSHEQVVNSAFTLVDTLIKDHFLQLVDALPELIDCLSQFASSSVSKSSDISLHAVSHIARAGTYLGDLREKEVKIDSSVESNESASNKEVTEFPVHDNSPELNVWLCALRSLATISLDDRLEVRSSALQCMFKILRTYGGLFSPNVWQVVFKSILFPIFDDELQTSNNGRVSSNPHDWLRTTCQSALSSLVDLFARFFHTVSFLTNELISLITSIINCESEELAKIGCKNWALFIQVIGPLINSDDAKWDLIINSFMSLLDLTLPHELCSDLTLNTLKSSPMPEPISLSFCPPASSSNATNDAGNADSTGRKGSIVSSTSISAVNSFLSTKFESKLPSNIPINNNPITLNLDDQTVAALKDKPPFHIRLVFTQCNVHHLLLDSCSELISRFFSSLLKRHLDILLNSVSSSALFARSFNNHHDLRKKLWVIAFFSYQKNWPDLLFQEAHALTIYTEILIKLIEDFQANLSPDSVDSCKEESMFLSLCLQIFAEYLEKDVLNRESISSGQPALYDDELRCKESVVRLLLNGLKRFTSVQFKRCLKLLFPSLLNLVECSVHSIRKDLKLLLRFHLPNLLEIN